jgi:acyl-CoA dehydrogenase family protein 9
VIDKAHASFMRSLCMGEIEEEIVFPFPEPSAAEAETLHAVFGTVASMLGPRAKDFAAWDRAGEMPRAFIEELKAAGLFSMVIPEEHGGMGFGSTAYSRALQEIGKYDGSVAVTIGAHSSIGLRGLLLFGTEDQRRRYYPKLATGEMIAAFCLTEPSAGSDAASIKTTAVRDGDGWILNGEKIWITNGGIADFFTVFAKTSMEGRGHITAFIVTRDMKGVSTGPHEDKMGLRASSTTTVVLEDVHVPAANVLGEVGMGFKVAMKILNGGRTGLGGGSVGGMKRLIELATQQARDRSQFGRPIASFGLVQQKLGQMVIDCYASESVVNLVAGLVDRGYQDTAVEAAISKVMSTEAIFRTADEALQIAGGGGYMRELPYERILRDCRINRIFEGTNEILRLFIALTAMNDVSQELKEVGAGLKGIFDDPIKGFGPLSEYAKRRASLATGIRRTKAHWTLLHESLAKEAAMFEEATTALAVAADRLLRKHGKRIIEEQLPTRRLADVLIDLFALAAVLSRVSSAIDRDGPEKAAREREILRAFAFQAKRRVDGAFALVEENDDAAVRSLAAHVVELGKYPWDNV